MATLNFRRFTHLETLRQINPKHLKALLTPHQVYLDAHGVTLEDGKPLDYQKLSAVLAEPDDAMPHDLINALYYIHDMSESEDMDELLDDNNVRPPAERIVFDFTEEPTPLDVAVQVWLADRNRLEERHAKRRMTTRRRSYECYQSRTLKPFVLPNAATIKGLQDALDDWYYDHRRGRDCRVFVYRKPDGVWILVRHGEPMRREGSHEGKKSSAVCYRPERYDVLIYDEHGGDLQINACGRKEKLLFCEKFGFYLFGDPQHFPATNRYTLEPLLRDGPNALACADVDGIEEVVLREIRIGRGGSQNEIEIRKAKDLFASFAERKHQMSPNTRLWEAKFEVKFSDSRAPRMVTIKPKNIAEYGRDEDAVLIEKWLGLRGFIKDVNEDEADADADEADETTVAAAAESV